MSPLYPYVVFQCAILCGLLSSQAPYTVASGGDNLKNTVEDVFNPVLQQYSDLRNWLDGEEPASRSPDFQIHSTGSRVKRSPHLLCDGGNQCSLSLCPWKELYDYQSNRTPVNIRYAQCLTTSCNFNFSGVEENAQNILQAYTTCDVVRTDIRVVEDGQNKTITDWPIACICSQHLHYYNAQFNGEEEWNGNIDFNETNISRHEILRQLRLRHMYRLQQDQRQNTESFYEVMQRRQLENNRRREQQHSRRRGLEYKSRREREYYRRREREYFRRRVQDYLRRRYTSN